MTIVGTVSSPSERWIWYIFTVTFLVSMTKYLSNKQLKGGRVSFESQFQGAQSITVGKLCQCEQETAYQSYSIQSQYAELEQEVRLVVKSQSLLPWVSHFLQKGSISYRFYKFPKQRHHLGTKCSNTRLWWTLPIQTTRSVYFAKPQMHSLV